MGQTVSDLVLNYEVYERFVHKSFFFKFDFPFNYPANVKIYLLDVDKKL